MKNFGRAILCGLSFILIQPVFATPQASPQQDDVPHIDRDKLFKSKEEKRQVRERRKLDGKPHRHDKVHWKTGTTLPEQYRYTQYKIDYTEYPQLSEPSPYQQWLKVDHQYVLMNVLTNTIIKVIPE